MEKEIEDNYIKAGKIAVEGKEEARRIVKPGVKFLDIAEGLEQFIRQAGGQPAFPINISINDIAAHHTPTKNDMAVINDSDIVKIDLGVHIDGYVADTAVTINFNPDYDDLVKAAEAALQEAVKEVRPDALLSDISTTIENTIKGFGYKPIENLTGHGLAQYDLHTEPTVIARTRRNPRLFRAEGIKEGHGFPG
ncbi:MAG: M24 family metallopeptidase [Candidatus Aenigmarchaeota archaeon]|nr:M24 family metallopeptidase [Candidatus Aenigmarchaeota archaeon]